MFTFRAQMHGNEEGEGYTTYQAERYDVRMQPERKLVELFTVDGADPRWTLAVGRQPHGIFQIVYVMNAAGKTVDTIR